VPRRGIYIVRKSKREMIEMIQMWAALESMAARLATLHATDEEIAALRHLFDEFQNSPPSEHLESIPTPISRFIPRLLLSAAHRPSSMPRTICSFTCVPSGAQRSFKATARPARSSII